MKRTKWLLVLLVLLSLAAVDLPAQARYSWDYSSGYSTNRAMRFITVSKSRTKRLSYRDAIKSYVAWPNV